MTTQTTETAQFVLLGMEASARQRFEEMFAKGRYDVLKTGAHTDFPSGERFMVEYDCTGKTRYFYRERAFQMLSPIENRTVCLLAMQERMKVAS